MKSIPSKAVTHKQTYHKRITAWWVTHCLVVYHKTNLCIGLGCMYQYLSCSWWTNLNPTPFINQWHACIISLLPSFMEYDYDQVWAKKKDASPSTSVRFKHYQYIWFALHALSTFKVSISLQKLYQDPKSLSVILRTLTTTTAGSSQRIG